MDTGRVIPIRGADANGSKQPPTKMFLTIGNRRFRIDAVVRLSEVQPIEDADVIPIDRLRGKKEEA